MMIRQLVGVMFVLGLAADWCMAEDATKEPPLKYTLRVDGKEFPITLDKPIEVPGKFADPKVLLTAAATRTFRYGGVEFEYPAAFGWEAEIKAANQSWTLSGNDLTIMYHVLPEGATIEMLADAMIAQMGAEKTTTSESKQRLGDKEYVGKRLMVDALGARLNYELYALPGKSARILLFLDSLDESDKPSEEAATAIPLIARTFKDLNSPEDDKKEN